MAQTVAQHAHSTITDPAASSSLSSAVIRSTFNSFRTTYNDHDADSGVHFQSSVAGSRPAAGTAGRKWLDSDTLRIYFDTGSVWSEVAYALVSGTSPITINTGSTTNALIVKTTGAIQQSWRYDDTHRLDIGVIAAGAVKFTTVGDAGSGFQMSCADSGLVVQNDAGTAFLGLRDGDAGDVFSMLHSASADTVTLSGATVITEASAAGRAGIRLPHGTAPTSPTNGDMWTTSAGLFVRINGATVGPLA